MEVALRQTPITDTLKAGKTRASKSKAEKSSTEPEWLKIVNKWRNDNRIVLPRNCDRVSMQIQEPLRIPSNPDASKLVAEELERLTGLFLDDKANQYDIGHYILFSYAVRAFSPAKIGKATASDRHVTEPPVCPVLKIFYAMIKIRSRDLQLIAMRTLSKILQRLDPGQLMLNNHCRAIRLATHLLAPKPANDRMPYYY